jgi:hypothetical protein
VLSAGCWGFTHIGCAVTPKGFRYMFPYSAFFREPTPPSTYLIWLKQAIMY